MSAFNIGRPDSSSSFAVKNFLESSRLGIGRAWEGRVHLYLGISYSHLRMFREAKREFKVCEDHLTDYGFPSDKVYSWLAWVCKGLGEKVESEKYSRLSRTV